MKTKEMPNNTTKDADFNSKDDYIQSLELSVNILQNELREIIAKLNDEQDSESSMKSQTKNVVSGLDLSNCATISDVLDVLYSWLNVNLSIVELDLFLFDNKRQVAKLKEVNTSSTLEIVYNESEENGLIDWAIENKNIKIINYMHEENLSIKSLIIVPIVMMQKPAAVFLMNSTLETENLKTINLDDYHGFIAKAYYLISLMKLTSEKNAIKIEHSILRNQTLQASNQLAVSEIIMNINEVLYLPLKVIKSNLELIDKGVGGINRRLEIISNQFANLANIRQLMSQYSLSINQTPLPLSAIELVNAALEIVDLKTSKNGITLHTTFEIKDEIIVGIKTQLIFAIMNIISHSVDSMPDGGEINIGIYNTEENNKISIIITDNGLGLDSPEINGDLIALADLSERKIKARYLFLLSQHIICQHSGKYFVYFEVGKGTTYKIILPVKKTKD